MKHCLLALACTMLMCVQANATGVIFVRTVQPVPVYVDPGIPVQPAVFFNSAQTSYYGGAAAFQSNAVFFNRGYGGGVAAFRGGFGPRGNFAFRGRFRW